MLASKHNVDDMEWTLSPIAPAAQPYLRLQRYRVEHERFDGGMAVVERDVLALGEVAAVLAVDPRHDEFIMIEQFRIGAASAGAASAGAAPVVSDPTTPWLLELVAGTLEPGEAIEALARRELQEEAGLEAARVETVLSYLSSPGVTSERVHVLVAEIDSRQAGGLHGCAHEGEDIRVTVQPVSAVAELIANPRCGNSLTLIGLLWLQANYADLKARWLA
ncbi:unnamed protein product [Cyprideis torosa]|uniref:ADP-ribose pyrophosphatase n=1 Tax=Cyprideis torosa TaxID=163714 RepID=A0A7R8ZWQ8_9CRUS|nr:unnamed protein product [Cyprideis torosa]CAG0905734.1 unnamed protein product [Cyprideis torosa]